jgi:hypothetical protein
VQASGLGMLVGRFSRPLRGVGVLALRDPGLDISQCGQSLCEVPPGAGVPSVRFGAYINHHCVVGGVEVTGGVISATQQLCSGDDGVEF